jgi:hypothetical protein
MKINEIIKESKDKGAEEHSKPKESSKSMPKDFEAAHQGDIFRARDVGGYDRVYHMNRLMMAMAKADGKSTKPVDSNTETWFEKYNTIHPYTKEESNMAKAAMKTVPTDGNEASHDSKSREPDGINKVSPHHNPGPIKRKSK